MVKIVESSLNPLEQKFCDVYLHTGDVKLAFKESGIPLIFGRSEEGQGRDLLNKQTIKDYILMLSDNDTSSMETCIARLEAVRRESWRRGDYKHATTVESEIAKLRGWLIERSEVKSTNLNMGAASLGNAELMAILSSAQGKQALEKQGLMLGDGGKIKMIEVDYERL